MESVVKKRRSPVLWIVAAIPTVLLIAVIALVVYAMGQVGAQGDATQAAKTQNFAVQNETALSGQTVFLGDSITEYYPVAESFAAYTKETGTLVYNRGISAELSGHMLDRLEDSALRIRPKNLVILIGTNDLGQKIPVETITGNIRTVLTRTQEQSPETNIILLAVYPVDENREAIYDRVMVGSNRTNDKIRELNESLRTLAQERAVTFLDLTDALADENGTLRADYTIDGLHPSARGYEVITQAILPLLK